MKIAVRRRMVGNIPLLEVVPEEYVHTPLPLVIYYHGWQTAKELVLTQGRKLAKQKMRVLLPDAPNHGERRQAVSKIPSLTFFDSIQGNLFEFGYIVDYFKKLDLVTAQIGVGGVSMGGMTTCMLLTQHPEINVAACVMGSPAPLTYRARIEEHASQLGFYLPKDYRKLLAWIEEYDLSQQPESLAGRPLLFWHGREDEKIPYEDVATFVSGNPQENVIFESADERHMVKGQTMDQITDFFHQNLFG
ncbi:alpha/beta fold hydrolase [Enterococcus alishanensis]